MSTASPKQRFIESYKHEHATTKKVLAAYPPEKHDLKPHERSNSALQLARTFVVEEKIILRALTGQPVLDPGFPPASNTWSELMDELDAVNEAILAAGAAPDNPNLEGTAAFFVGPKQMGDIPMDRFLTFMLHDQIHHRGQMSVYVRLAGGKVPSIYGPSADEPWN